MNARRWGATFAASTALVTGAIALAPDSTPIASAATAAKPKAKPAYNPFALLHAKLPVCASEDGSGGKLPCASGPQEGVDYLVIRDGRRNRKTQTQRVIYIYRDHIEHGTI